MTARRLLLLVLIVTSTFTGNCQSSTGVGQDKKRSSTYIALHYAGSIGFLSTGIGSISSKQTRSVEFLIGYLPASIGGEQIVTLNGRFGISTKPYSIGKKIRACILNINLGISYAINCDYDVTRPAVYPEGYYWWSEAIRINLNMGSTVILNDRYSLYYELGTNELKVASYALNTNSLSMLDVMHLGFGIRRKI
jgi:hypothetical protein